MMPDKKTMYMVASAALASVILYYSVKEVLDFKGRCKPNGSEDED